MYTTKMQYQKGEEVRICAKIGGIRKKCWHNYKPFFSFFY